MKAKIVLVFILTLFVTSGTSAKESLKEKLADNDSQEYTLPEITVRGDSSMHSLKMEVIRAEELKFDIFNSLNSTDEFDITCEWYSPLGTRIKKWGCDVGYLRDSGAGDARDMISSTGSFSGSPGDAEQKGKSLINRAQRETELAWKKRALNKEMIALASEHPKLAIAMVRANAMQQYYKAAGRKRHGKNILVGNSKPDEKDIILNEIDILEAAFMDHSRGIMSDEIWARWDRVYRKTFNKKNYKIFWSSAHSNKKYADEFITYINSIISTER